MRADARQENDIEEAVAGGGFKPGGVTGTGGLRRYAVIHHRLGACAV